MKEAWGCFILVMLPFEAGCVTNSILNKCPFKRQCPVSSPGKCFSWLLFNLNSVLVLLAEGSRWKLYSHSYHVTVSL